MSDLSDLITKAAGGDADATAKIDAMSAASVQMADLKAKADELQTRLVDMTHEKDNAVARRREGRPSSAELDELNDLRQKSDQAEEARLLAAGEYETLKTRLGKERDVLKDKLEGERDDAIKSSEAAGLERDKTLIKAMFQDATDLFGERGTTILTPDIALSHYGQYVRFVPGENGGSRRVIVHTRTGEPILAENGDPATVAAGLAQLIETDDQAQAILRASGKTGSGAGAAHDSFNTSTATRAQIVAAAQRGDKDALKELRATRPAGQISGTHWEQEQDSAAS